MSGKYGWLKIGAAVTVLAVMSAVYGRAQETDEDALIVSEELLLEDAVNGGSGTAGGPEAAEASERTDETDTADLDLEDLNLDEAVLPAAPVEEKGVPVEVTATEEAPAAEEELPAEPEAWFPEVGMKAPAETGEVGTAVEAGETESPAELPEAAPAQEEPVLDEIPVEEPAPVIPAPEKPAVEELEAEAPAAATEAPVEMREEPEEAPAIEAVEPSVEEPGGAEDLDATVEAAISEALSEGVPPPPPLEDVAGIEEPDEASEEAQAAAAEEPTVEDLGEAALLEEPAEEQPAAERPILEEAGPEEPAALAEEPAVEEKPAETETAAAEEEAAGPRVIGGMTVGKELETDLDVMMRQERLRRQAYEMHAKETLERAEKSLDERDYRAAERLFEEALRYIGDREAVQRDRERIRKGMGRNYYEWALSLQKQNNLEAARDTARRAVGLKYPHAEVLLKELEAPPPEKEEEAKRKPTRRVEETEFLQKQQKISSLLKRGKQHLLNGEYDRAQQMFEAVLQPDVDPQNTEAIRMI